MFIARKLQELGFYVFQFLISGLQKFKIKWLKEYLVWHCEVDDQHFPSTTFLEKEKYSYCNF